MKVIDSVKKSFFLYPSLYARKTYESVKFDVLHQDFIVLGNGIEWAHTKDPKKAGYLTEPKSRKVKGNWVRNYDLPYGRFKVEIDIEPYLENEIYQLREIDHEETKRSLAQWAPFIDIDNISKKSYHISEIRNYCVKVFDSKKQTLFTEQEFNKLPPNTLLPGEKYNTSYKYFLRWIEKKDSSEKRNPYPNFSREYSCFWEPGVRTIQDDWREVGIEHLQYWKEYFDDNEKIKSYSSYPNPKELEQHIKKYYVKEGKTIKQIAKEYEFPGFDGKNYKEMAFHRWEKDLKETKEFIEETIYELNK